MSLGASGWHIPTLACGLTWWSCSVSSCRSSSSSSRSSNGGATAWLDLMMRLTLGWIGGGRVQKSGSENQPLIHSSFGMLGSNSSLPHNLRKFVICILCHMSAIYIIHTWNKEDQFILLSKVLYIHFPMFPMFPGTTSSCICSSVVSVFNLVFFLFKDSFLSGFCCGLTCSTFMNVWCLSEATFLFSIRHFLLFFLFLRVKFPI